MRYCALEDTCYALLSGKAPPGAVMLDAPFSPLVALVSRDLAASEASFAVACPADLEERGIERLLKNDMTYGDPAFLEYLEQHGLSCINTNFPSAFTTNSRPFLPGRSGLSLHLVGLGDVGSTLLTGLVLFGTPFDSIGIYDPDGQRCLRMEMEANQILPPSGHRPRVCVLAPDALFDCDVFVFTASAGVPALGSKGDVRLLQRDKNRAILAAYAALARKTKFNGLFFQVSDPVDLLCQDLYRMSNTTEDGKLDYLGLRPEQIFGLGLGVMLARADYAARQRGISDFLTTGRGYGPHGSGLVIANALGDSYDDALSRALTQGAVTANLAVRQTGYKPYIAPALSSACTQILHALQGKSFDAAIALDGVYMGCRARLTNNGLLQERGAMPPALFARIQESYDMLKEHPL